MRTDRGRPSRQFALALTAVLLGWTGGCERKQNAYAPPPPAEVVVAQATKRRVPQTIEFTGVARAKERVELRARVKGFLLKRSVEGGQRVKVGELLFSIDPRTFKASLDQALADLESKKASLSLAETTLRRTKAAVAGNAVSAIEVDKAQAERDSASAQVDLSAARLEAARLDLEYCSVRAPINGRLSIETLDEGTLVGANEATLLGTILNDEQVYAAYSIPERTVLELMAQFANRRPGEDGRPLFLVLLGLANETGYPHEGRFDKADNVVDAATGTVRVEAVFDNPKGQILPGSFVRVKAILGEGDETLMVPDVAIGADQLGRFVLVVGKDNVVERRSVKVGPAIERLRPVVEGLNESDTIIVTGLQRARPGAKVDPKQTPKAAAGA